MILDYPFHHKFFGCISLFCTTVGFPLNMLALASCSFQRRNTASKLLYSSITIVDGIICLLMLPISISNFWNGKAMLFQYKAICEGWSYLWGCFSRISIFLIGLLNLLRTNSLLCPLRRQRINEIAVPMFVYMTLIAIQCSVPWWYPVRVSYYQPLTACVWGLQSLFDHFNAFEKYTFYTVTFLMEFVFPIIPITVGCIISVFQLRHKPLSGSPETSRKNKKQATRMIIALTGVYIFFNIPYCIVLTLDSIGLMTNNKFKWDADLDGPESVFIYNIIYIHTIALNSTVDAIIYTVKMKSLKSLRRDTTATQCSSKTKFEPRQFSASLNVRRFNESSFGS